MDTGREVAMAMMPDFQSRPQADLDRFMCEARITARLEHPNIIPVYDMGLDRQGAPFFTMKYLRGESLDLLLQRVLENDQQAAAKYSLDRVLQIFIRVCNAVRFAHSRNILHLDIKPNNVSLGDFGEVSVLDWGLATEIVSGPDGKRRLQRPVSKGTPGFMSPEQIVGGTDVDERADIYSLGALLYAMLTLRNPLAGNPADAVLNAAMQDNIPPPSEAAPGRDIPAALEAVVLKAMAFRREDRYASVEALREDVVSFQTGFAPVAENASFLRRTTLFINRNFVVIVLLGIIAVLGITLVFVLQ
jgi:serine/threonine protein kinase